MSKMQTFYIETLCWADSASRVELEIELLRIKAKRVKLDAKESAILKAIQVKEKEKKS